MGLIRWLQQKPPAPQQTDRLTDRKTDEARLDGGFFSPGVVFVFTSGTSLYVWRNPKTAKTAETITKTKENIVKTNNKKKGPLKTMKPIFK